MQVLELACNIVTHPDLAKFMKDRYEEFYSQLKQEPSGAGGAANDGPNNPANAPPPPRNHLFSRLDFYAVEIKSKIVCSFFKFFLRDELAIQKKAKQCLKRLIEKHGGTILPRKILNDCVKPILNTVQRNSLQDS